MSCQSSFFNPSITRYELLDPAEDASGRVSTLMALNTAALSKTEATGSKRRRIYEYTLPKGGANEVISIRDYDESLNKIIKQDL